MLDSYLSGIKRFKGLVHYYLLDESNKDLKDKEKKLNDLIDHHLDYASDIKHDLDLSNMVNADTAQIIMSLPNRDIYTWDLQKPLVRVLRDGDDIKVYGFITGGGLLLYYKKSSSSFQIHTLGEDDGYYFLDSRYFYEPVICGKVEIVSLLSEVLATFNSIEK